MLRGLFLLTQIIGLFLGLFGECLYWIAAALTLGAFVPIANLSIVGSVNYFDNGRGNGVFILLLAVVAAGLTVLNKFKFLWLVGVLTAILFTLSRISMIQSVSDFKSTLVGSVVFTFFDVWGFIQPQWGFLLFGIVALIFASFIPAILARTKRVQ